MSWPIEFVVKQIVDLAFAPSFIAFRLLLAVSFDYAKLLLPQQQNSAFLVAS